MNIRKEQDKYNRRVENFFKSNHFNYFPYDPLPAPCIFYPCLVFLHCLSVWYGLLFLL